MTIGRLTENPFSFGIFLSPLCDKFNLDSSTFFGLPIILLSDKTKTRMKSSTNQTAEEEIDSVGVEGDLEMAEKENEDCSNFETVEETITSQRRAKKTKKGDTGPSSLEKVTDERNSSNEGVAVQSFVMNGYSLHHKCGAPPLTHCANCALSR